jgi:hypothetical protein
MYHAMQHQKVNVTQRMKSKIVYVKPEACKFLLFLDMMHNQANEHINFSSSFEAAILNFQVAQHDVSLGQFYQVWHHEE